MKVHRFLPTPEARGLVEMTAELADRELAPLVAGHEHSGQFPRDALRVLGRAGLLALPFAGEHGGGGHSYEVYLHVVELIAARWLAVAEAVNVHTLSAFALTLGTDRQRAELLPAALAGDLLGANCISEAGAGSDAGALACTARRDGTGYVLDGVKTWVTHAGIADYYLVYCRTGGSGARGISCLAVDAASDGLSFGTPVRKLGVAASPTAEAVFAGVRVPADRLCGREGRGFLIAMDAMDLGRLAIGACAVGVAQAALDHAVGYAKPRIDQQGVGFPLADMATRVAAGRAMVLHAARMRDAGLPFSAEAAKAKLFCTDMAMAVTTEAVQVLGEDGYRTDHPVERYLREAKLLQIVEGTNQIQRVVIARSL